MPDPPRCRGCGRVAGRRANRLTSYDLDTHAYTCGGCRDRTRQVEVTCRHCGRRVSVQEGRARILESLAEGDGGLTYICLACFRPGAADKARATFLAKHYGIRVSDPPEVKRAALADHARKIMQAIGGRDAMLSRARVGRLEGVSDAGRRRRTTIGLLLSKAARRREFRLCPLCQKLSVLTGREVRAGRPGFHGACARQWDRSEDVRRWRREIGHPRDPLSAVRRRRLPYPLPPRPANRPPGSSELEQHFRWTVRRYGRRESWRDIARAEFVTHGGARKGVLSFVARLPESWTVVFGGGNPGSSLDELLPIDQLRRASGVAES